MTPPGGGLAPGPGIVTREVGELATGRRHGMARAPIIAVRDGSAGCRVESGRQNDESRSLPYGCESDVAAGIPHLVHA
jgi:hypothetical protein